MSRKVTKVRVTPELAHRFGYNNHCDCALFNAMKQAGINVKEVGTIREK